MTVLCGADHVDLGDVALAPAGTRAAVALSRGRLAKSYWHLDPNEDVAAAVAGPRATLLACADGHNGTTASHVAVRALLSRVGDDPPPELGEAGWLTLFAAAGEAVFAATAAPGAAQPRSRTVLVTALVGAGAVSWAAIGDAALLVGTADGLRQLNDEAAIFLGGAVSARRLAAAVEHGHEPLAPGEWVVIVTDGLSEFIAPRRPAQAVPAALAGDPEPVEAAQRIVELAFAAGAGDNVAVALTRAPT